MQVHLITIGSEILIGHTVNSNFVYIARQLADAGFEVAREVCIPDNKEIMRRTFADELAAADIVISMGGLGPTKDDITREVAAETIGCDLVEDNALKERIRNYLKQRHVDLPEDSIRTQAAVPRAADILTNANGTAPGLWCPAGDKVLILLPGPPRELKYIFTEEVMPRLQARWQPQTYRKELSVCGVPESRVADAVEQIIGEDHDGIEIAYCARPSQVDVRLSGGTEHREYIDQLTDTLREHFGDAVLDEEDEDVVAAIGRLMQKNKLWLAVAESCSAGQIGKRITDRPGASAFFAGGYICYRNDWKEGKLGVRQRTLQQFGAVSRETAQEMLSGLIKRDSVDVAVVTTGIAGPDGGTADKPVGLVYIGTAVGEKQEITEYRFPGSRENVRERTTAAALNQLRRQLLQHRD